MSSAANDPREKLEDEFKRRMYDAEAAPSQHLWDRIDHSLTVLENGEYKKHVVFYRQLAAACVALLVLAATAGSYYFSNAPATPPTLAQLPPAPDANTDANNSTELMASASEGQTSQLTELEDASLPTSAVKPTERHATPGNIFRQKAGIHAASPSATAAATRSNNTAASARAEGFPSSSWETVETNTTSYFNLTITNRRMLATQQAKPAFSDEALTDRPRVNPAAEPGATDDFRQQSLLAMARARQQEEEQQMLRTRESIVAGMNKTEKEEGKDGGRWSLAMAYAPGYFDQNMSASSQGRDMATLDRNSIMPTVTSISAAYMSEAREEYEQTTDPGFSYGVEVKSGFKLGKKLKLLAGLGFLQNTARSKSSYVLQQPENTIYFNATSPNKPAIVYLPSISTDMAATPYVVAKRPAFDVDYRYRYLSVPLGLQYEGGVGNEWFWYGGAGVAANILLQTSILASAPDVEGIAYSRNEESPFQQTQWSGNASAGVGKRLGGNLSVTMGPEFRSYFSSMLSERESPQGKPYTIGMNLAVNYELSGGKRNR